MNSDLKTKAGFKTSNSLTLFPSVAIVVGSVVGSGIFISSARMARSLESAPLLLAVWLLTGILTVFGALTQCELVGQMPKTGGLYQYLKEIYGAPIGFLYGWANFIVVGSGSIAAVAYVFATYLGEFVPLPRLSPELEGWPLHFAFIGTVYPLAHWGAKAVGTGLIFFLTGLNVRGVKVGAIFQSVTTSAKVLAILAVVGAAFYAGRNLGSFAHLTETTPQGLALSGWGWLGAVSVAMSGAFWAYDGWGNLSFVAGEVRDPTRTVPKAIILGTGCFVGLYLLINVAYLYILPIGSLGRVPGDRVASGMVSAVLGSPGAMWVAALIVLCTLSTDNSSVLTNARVYYAMARDGLFWRPLGVLHPRFQTPHLSLLSQGFWAVVLLLTGSFDSITSMYVFVNWALYALMAIGVFILRARNPDAKRPFSVPGYPWVPTVFTLFSLAYLAVTLITDVTEYRAGHQPLIKSVAGLALVLTGLPVYWALRRKKAE